MKSFQFHIIHAEAPTVPHSPFQSQSSSLCFAVEWSLQFFFFLFSPEIFLLFVAAAMVHFNFVQMENNNQGKIIKWTQARKVQEIGK